MANMRSKIDRVKELSREETLQKVPRLTNRRVVLSLPFDKRLPDVAGMVKHRHQCLLDSDINAKEYMPLPQMVSYTRTKNLRDILVGGFRKCNKRVNCALCQHSEPGIISSYTFPVSNKTVRISTPITCTDNGVYLAFCRKDTGQCPQVAPTYAMF
jgi:hypothetical protein